MDPVLTLVGGLISGLVVGIVIGRYSHLLAVERARNERKTDDELQTIECRTEVFSAARTYSRCLASGVRDGARSLRFVRQAAQNAVGPRGRLTRPMTNAAVWVRVLPH
jgi:hypothetical protein